MAKTISATQAARNFRALLNEIEDTGETFHIERHGRRVAELRPVGVTGSRFTGRDLAELMRRLPPPDPEFGPDLARVRADCQPAPSRDPLAGVGIVLDNSIVIALERRGGQVPSSWVSHELSMAAISAAELLACVHRADMLHRAPRAAFVEGILALLPVLDSD